MRRPFEVHDDSMPGRTINEEQSTRILENKSEVHARYLRIKLSSLHATAFCALAFGSDTAPPE